LAFIGKARLLVVSKGGGGGVLGGTQEGKKRADLQRRPRMRGEYYLLRITERDAQEKGRRRETGETHRGRVWRPSERKAESRLPVTGKKKSPKNKKPSPLCQTNATSKKRM